MVEVYLPSLIFLTLGHFILSQLRDNNPKCKYCELLFIPGNIIVWLMCHQPSLFSYLIPIHVNTGGPACTIDKCLSLVLKSFRYWFNSIIKTH